MDDEPAAFEEVPAGAGGAPGGLAQLAQQHAQLDAQLGIAAQDLAFLPGGGIQGLPQLVDIVNGPPPQPLNVNIPHPSNRANLDFKDEK